MAERKFDFMETIGRKKRCLAGSFAPDTANAPTTVRGSGFSVVRTSAGLFTITFANTYGELVSATSTLQLAATDNFMAQVGSYVAADRTLEIRVIDDAGAGQVQDVAANANNRVNFVCVFNDALTV